MILVAHVMLIALAMCIGLTSAAPSSRVLAKDSHPPSQLIRKDSFGVNTSGGTQYPVERQFFVAAAIWELVTFVVEGMTEAEVIEAGLSFREASFVENAVLEFEHMAKATLNSVRTYAFKAKVSLGEEATIGSLCRRLASETRDVELRMDNLLHPNVIDRVGHAGLTRFYGINNAAARVQRAAQDMHLLRLRGTGSAAADVIQATASELEVAVNELSALSRNG